MAKAPKESKKIIRSIKLKLPLNKSKSIIFDKHLRDYRNCMKAVAHLQWLRFHHGYSFDNRHDEAKNYRKQTVAERSKIISALKSRYDSSSDEPTKLRKIPPLAPGLDDPMADWKAKLGYSFQDMAKSQAVGMLQSWLSNRQNDFKNIVSMSSLSDDMKHQLYAVNSKQAWFWLNKDVYRKVNGQLLLVRPEARSLAIRIMRRVFRKHRKPRFDFANMVIDQRSIKFQESRTSKKFDRWLELRLIGNRKVNIPVVLNDYYRNHSGDLALTWQINKDRETGQYTATCSKDIRSEIDHSKYVPLTDEIALDFGLNTLFATDQGELLGRKFLDKLKTYDHTIVTMVRHIQRSGKKPRDSKRYRTWIVKLRGFVKTEICRILNKIIKDKRPALIVLERLNFQNSVLSKRLNRIISNCGRSVIKQKLQTLEEVYGVKNTEINPAYTSQECSSCNYIDKRNRNEDRFCCKACGLKVHADVNAARNIRKRRSLSALDVNGKAKPVTALRKQEVLTILVNQYCERNTRPSVKPDDPRLANPYFKGWQEEQSLRLAA